MAVIDPLLSPSAFEGLRDCVHLCTGGEGPWLRSQSEVYEKFVRWKSQGKPGREEIYECGERCREKIGELWGVDSQRVVFMPSAAEGMSWLARGLDWEAGDNVVTANLEFPSVAYAWRNLAARGVETRLVPHQHWEVAEADLLAAVDARTKVLAVSQVSFYTGQCLDIEFLADSLAQLPHSPLLAVDATHASGVVSVSAGKADICVSSSYKWMLATHGIAPCYVSERAEEEIQSTSFGWHNLQVWPPQGAERALKVEERSMPAKMEPGNPAMVVAMYLDHSLQVLLDVGIVKIESHARDLSELLAKGLERVGCAVISPQRRKGRSGNTCFLAEDAKGVEGALSKEGILVWGEYGRVRVSGHLYNGSDDVERLLEAMERIV